MDAAEAEQTKHVAILVHGTWGRGLIFRAEVAPWCREGSGVRDVVSIALNDRVAHRVKFVPFNWSGLNTHAARLDASERLRACVSNLADSYPWAQIHLVAHSHGGNIVFYALRDSDTLGAIASIACFSTPFLHVRARPLGGSLAGQIRDSFVTLLCVCLMSAAIAAIVGSDYSLVVTPLVLNAVILAVWYARKKTLHFGADEGVTDQLELPDRASVSCPVLLVRAPYDEASVALAAAQFVSKLLTLVIKLPATIANVIGSDDGKLEGRFGIHRLRKRFGAGAAIMALFIGSIAFAEDLGTLWIAALLVLGAGILVLLLCSLVGFVLAPLLAVACVLLAVSLIPFGRSLVLQSLFFLEISAEATPPGLWEVHQLQMSDDSLEGQSDLRHATHSESSALGVLMQWLWDEFSSPTLRRARGSRPTQDWQDGDDE